MTYTRRRGAILVLVAGILTAIVLSRPPIAQPPTYHAFADTRAMLGVPHALNVLSNLPFVFAGAGGLWLLLRRRATSGWEPEDAMYAAMFTGVVLTAPGSAWYHWAPDNTRLVWDRLPMTVGFMAFFAAAVTERVSRVWGLRLFPLLLAAGAACVVYWDWTERAGAGDLRPYLLVQFLPLLLVPLLFALYPPKYTRGGDILVAIALYGAAKSFEWLDRQIFDMTGLASGHTLKHITAAAGVAWLLRMLALRQRANGGDALHAHQRRATSGGPDPSASAPR